jgi:DNA-binding protein HU-beta
MVGILRIAFLYLTLNFVAKIRKISVIKQKKMGNSTFFHEFLHFFHIFVCFMNCFAYICERNLNNVLIFNHLIGKIMNKTELIEKIAAGAGLTKADSKKALDATIAAIKGALVAGDKVALVGFGTFSVNERPAREGINPATKEKINIAAKKVAKFKAGAELADAIK